MQTLQAGFGFIVFLVIAWLCSEDRRRIEWRVIAPGILAQFFLAGVLLHTEIFTPFFQGLNALVNSVRAATREGSRFVFGHLSGGAPPFEVSNPDAVNVFAFDVLPLLFVIGGLSGLLWHWRVLPLLIWALSWALRRTMRLSGAVSFSACANIFVSMVESPLLIRQFIPAMSRSQLFTVMSVGLATIAGTMFVPYAAIIQGVVAEPVTHLLTASIISVPAALVLARIMIPESIAIEAAEERVETTSEFQNTIDAVVTGAMRTGPIFLNIIIMLIVFIAFVDLIDQGLANWPAAGGEPVTLNRIFGWLFFPLVYAMGIPWSEAGQAGALMGLKTVLNEFIAFVELSRLPSSELSERSRVMMTYALCGFANFGSVGIMTGAFIAIAPERKQEIQVLAFKSLISGTLATLMTGCVVGLIYIG